jgi:NAD(P)H dehydrogenase (quinone)
MTRILVLYYSSYGHVRDLAQAEAEGALSVPGARVDIRRIPETVPEEVRRNAGFIEDETPIASPADLADYDGIIFGTPTRFGMMAGQMKQFLDQAGGLWAQNALVGKVAAVFASTGSQHGGHEATLLSTHIPLMHYWRLALWCGNHRRCRWRSAANHDGPRWGTVSGPACGPDCLPSRRLDP